MWLILSNSFLSKYIKVWNQICRRFIVCYYQLIWCRSSSKRGKRVPIPVFMAGLWSRRREYCIWSDRLCEKANSRISIYRAHFSALIPEEIWRSIRTLTPPDEKLAKAADARQEIDLRIGCAYTRFQTLLLRNSVPEIDTVVSYGPCQFPTLGFVVERYLQRHVWKCSLFLLT